MKLKYMPYAQAQIIKRTNNDIILQSYDTKVAGIINGYAYCNGLYSATTRRHIGAFAKEYGLTYQDFKHMYNDKVMMNIETREEIAL